MREQTATPFITSHHSSSWKFRMVVCIYVRTTITKSWRYGSVVSQSQTALEGVAIYV